ncbi:MAG TPA: pitrilysin family protein [Candidatus Binataceae bacterium]|nr:pitrilysin family protein [Candidatus Binataceae bacterium]
MMRKSVLANGVRVLTEEMPQALSASLGIWVANGSRYETPAENGVSHFIEHLLFKGTPTRSAAQIAEEMDAVGGNLNAFTGKEYTCYYARVLGEDFPMATGLLADIFLHSVFDPEEIDRERQVILQEISQAEDTPDDFIHDLFNLHFWEGHPLSLPIFGSVATVNAIDRALMTSFMSQRYRAERVLIAAAGKLDHARLVAQCENLFNGIAAGAPTEKLVPPAISPGVFNYEKDLEQAHICLGGPSIGVNHELRYAAYVLNTALGGGMSSRLFQEVREKAGKVYTIYSFLSSHLDCGYVGIYAGTNPEWVNEVLDITLRELRAIYREGLRPAELRRAKSQLKGNMLLGMESTESRMNRIARNEIYFGRDITPEETASEIERVTNDQIVELAQIFFDPARMGLALLGKSNGTAIDSSIFNA